MSLFAQEAERLVLLGYHLFQCLPKSKDPFAGDRGTAPKGCNSASGDLETIKRWWSDHPHCNIGLKCDNLLVIDVDNKNGKNGNADFSRIMDRLGPVKTGPISQSGNHGYHLLFKRPDADIKGSKGISWEGEKTGIDIQVGNQYIVVPPSVHPDTGAAYYWRSPICPVDELPVLPDAWIEHVLPHRHRAGGPQTGASAPSKLIAPDGRLLSDYASGATRSGPLEGEAYRDGTARSRCQKYLEKVPVCIAGQGGDEQLFKTACVIFWDFGLSEAEGMPLLQQYNSRCLPPWTQNRLDYKMRQALEANDHGKPRGHLLDKEREKDFGVDLSNFMVKTEPKTGKLMDVMPERMLYVPGFIHKVTEFSMQGSPHPNLQLSTVGALACQSFLVSRKVRSADTARPSVYLLALAGSGSGKDYPRKVNQHILTRIGMATHNLETCASGEGLEDRITLKQVILLQTDEFNFMLTDFTKGIESRFRTLESVILRLYSSASGSYTSRVKAGKEEPLTVQQPGLVIFGTATPHRFERALTIDLIEGGFVSRCVVMATDERSRTCKPKELDTMSDDILEIADYWANFKPVNPETGKPQSFVNPVPTLHVVDLTPEAESYMADFAYYADDQNLLNTNKNEMAAILWTRVHEAACRLALVYACSKNHLEPIIDKDAAKWACEFTNWTCEQLIRTIKHKVAENPFHAIWLRIEDVIRRNGGKASTSLLINKLKISSKQLQEAIDAMGIGRRIALIETKTKGRSRYEYTLLDEAAQDKDDESVD